MKIFLSGAKKEDGYQADPSISLGLYKSSVEVQDQLINNLFPPISQYTIQSFKPESRAVFIVNDDDVTYTNLQVWLEQLLSDESPDSPSTDFPFITTMELGYVVLVADNCGEVKFPSSISNPAASPYNVTFVSPTADDPLVLPDIESGMAIGLWLRRKMTPESQEPFTDEALLALLNKTLSLPQQEDYLLQFTWD